MTEQEAISHLGSISMSLIDTTEEALGRQLTKSEQAGLIDDLLSSLDTTSNTASDDIDMTPKKACLILKDGGVHDRPLTKDQRGMFGAKCGERGFPSTNASNLEDLHDLRAYRNTAEMMTRRATHLTRDAKDDDSHGTAAEAHRDAAKAHRKAASKARRQVEIESPEIDGLDAGVGSSTHDLDYSAVKDHENQATYHDDQATQHEITSGKVERGYKPLNNLSRVEAVSNVESCPRCGASMTDGDKECPRCGAVVENSEGSKTMLITNAEGVYVFNWQDLLTNEELGENAQFGSDLERLNVFAAMVDNEFASDDQRNAFWGAAKDGKIDTSAGPGGSKKFQGEVKSGGEGNKGGATGPSKEDHNAAKSASDAAVKRSGIAKKVNVGRQPGEHDKASEAHHEAAKAHDKIGGHEAAAAHRKAAAEHDAKGTRSGLEKGAADKSKSADNASATARRANSAKAHLSAADSHREASTAHKEAGNHDMARKHDRLAASHDSAADSFYSHNEHHEEDDMATRRQMLRTLSVNCSCEADREVLANLSDHTLTRLYTNALPAVPVAPIPPGRRPAGSNATTGAAGEDRTGGVEEEDEMNPGESEEPTHQAPEVPGVTKKRGAFGGTKVANQSLDQWLSDPSIHPEARELIQNAREVNNREKARMIDRLLVNVDDTNYKKRMGEKLMAKSLPELRDMLAMIPEPRRPFQLGVPREAMGLYFGATGGPLTHNYDEESVQDVLPLPSLNFADGEDVA